MIRRAPHDRRYVVVANDTVRDERLSWKARGLLCYLLSMPDDWTASAEHLASEGPDGEHAVRGALKELEAGGYLVRRRHRNERGHWVHESLIYEQPQGSSGDGHPAEENRGAENRGIEEVPQQEVPIAPDGASPPLEPKKPRARNLYFDALVELFGPATTRARASFYGSTAGQLKEAGATPDEVLERGRRMLAKGWTDAGPGALVKHWDSLSADPTSAYAGQPPARPASRPDPRRP